MTAYRLWLQEPAGSPNCPAGVPNCVNTGSYDPSRAQMCGDPQQFANFQDALAYATSKGEVMMQVSSAAQAQALCSVKPPVTASATNGAPPGGGCSVNCTTGGGTGGTGTTAANTTTAAGGSIGAGSGASWSPGRTAGGTTTGTTAGAGNITGSTGSTGTTAGSTTSNTTTMEIFGFPWWVVLLVALFLLRR